MGVEKVEDRDVIEAFEERAAISEFDGGLSRQAAEAQAIEDVVRRHGQRARFVVERHRGGWGKKRGN